MWAPSLAGTGPASSPARNDWLNASGASWSLRRIAAWRKQFARVCTSPIDADEFYRLLEGVTIDDTNIFNARLKEW
jgi:hypothetical protein